MTFIRLLVCISGLCMSPGLPGAPETFQRSLEMLLTSMTICFYLQPDDEAAHYWLPMEAMIFLVTDLPRHVQFGEQNLRPGLANCWFGACHGVA